MTNMEFWEFRSDVAGMDIVGYRVEATDGHIGKIDESSKEAGAGYVVVDTGPWIFGKKVLIPAGMVSRVDATEETVHIDRTKEDIKNAPEFDENNYREPEYRDKLSGYYGPGL